VVGLHAVEIVFGLRIDHAEHGISVGFTFDVGNAPVVAGDGYIRRMCGSDCKEEDERGAYHPGTLDGFGVGRNMSLILALVCAQGFDVLIRNGHIMDGTGSPWYSADVGIRDGKIAAMGRLPGATGKTVIDAQGLLVTPGFIDMLGQSEMTILVEP